MYGMFMGCPGDMGVGWQAGWLAAWEGGGGEASIFSRDGRLRRGRAFFRCVRASGHKRFVVGRLFRFSTTSKGPFL